MGAYTTALYVVDEGVIKDDRMPECEGMKKKREVTIERLPFLCIHVR